MNKSNTSKKTTWEKLNKQSNPEKIPSESLTQEETPNTQQSESPPLTQPAYEELKKKMIALEKERDQYKDESLRSLAEAQNTRRLSQMDIENARKFSLETFIKDLLPVQDSLERALDHVTTKENHPNVQKIKEGIELTLKQLGNVLEKNGIIPINPCIGDPFNSDFHQALRIEDSTDQSPNTIIQVNQKGYLLHKRLLRAANVTVAKRKEEN